MGDLDDAIREHLELKRKHGAPEEEIALKEREAQQQGALPREPGAATDDLGLPRTGEPEPSAPLQSSAEPAPPVAVPPANEHEPDEVLPEDALELDVPQPESFPASDLDAPEPESTWAEEDLAEAPAEPEEREPLDETLLEETPDFLEDTPEQDRLWFEQRPPKDFDFDD
jgi:hypothetical protein